VYHAKTAAILSYAREYEPFVVPKHTANLRRCLPTNVYVRLHVSFSRALRTLAEKGLIHYTRSEADVRRVHRLAVVKSFRSGSRERRRTRRKSVFVLTDAGASEAARLLRANNNAPE
jgi:hypothetical protein